MSQYRKPGQGGYGMGTRSSVPPRAGTTGSRPAGPSGPAGRPSVPPTTRTAQPTHTYGGSRSYGGSSTGGSPRRSSGGTGKWLIVILLLLVAAGVAAWLLLSGGNKPQSEETLPSATQTAAALTPTPTVSATHLPSDTPSSTPRPTSTPTQTSVPATVTKAVQPGAALFQLYKPELRWYMQHLTDNEKTLFAILYDGLAAAEKTVNTPLMSYTIAEFERVLAALRKDCPELVHFNSDASVSYITQNDYLKSVTFTYLHDTTEDNLSLTHKVLDEVNSLISPAEKQTDNLAVEYRLYRQVIERATYDKEFEFCSNADAVFLHGKAKCTGFASAFNLACRMYGIPCIYVTGDATDDEGTAGHAWNYVQIDGDWYVCDPTWDSNFAASFSAYPEPLSTFLNYFNLTQEQSSVSHVLDSKYAQYGWDLPKCTSEKASFWNAFGSAALVTDETWQDVLVEQLNQVARGERQVIALRAESQKAYDKILPAFTDRVDEWIKRSSNYCSYSCITSNSSKLFALYQIQWNQEQASRTNGLKVYFFDVGDADAALVDCEGHYMLIDGGTEKSGSSQLYSFLQNNGITYVDALVVTHPHSDHAGGLCGALAYEKCSFGTFYSSVLSSDNKSFNTLLEKAAQRGLYPVVPERGMQFQLGSAVVTFLSPEAHKSYENVNNKSLVVRVDYGQNSFLFTGDIMENAELDLLAGGMNLKADVLKVAHHGAASSSGLNFLQAVSPSVAIISCGANLQDHPDKATLERLLQTTGMILRTDEHGEIVLFSDGKKLTYKTER